eukprot:COSAG01_NODE_3807_length_5677_cov_7.965041_4_plen_166_part_00
MSKTVDADPTLSIHNSSGHLCHQRGDPTFPQPAEGMTLFNMSNERMRRVFVQTAVAAAQGPGKFKGVFVDGAAVWNKHLTALGGGGDGGGGGGYATTDGSQASLAGPLQGCELSPAQKAALGAGNALLLSELQVALGSSRLVIAKDGGDCECPSVLFHPSGPCSL